MPTIRAIGSRPCARAAASEATISAQAPSLIPEALPAVTVPPSRNGVGSAASLLERRLGARMLVPLDHAQLAALPRHRDRNDLDREAPGLDRGCRPLLRAEREGVLIGAPDPVLGSDVLGGLGHRVDAVLRLDQGVDEAPAERRVVQLGRARERALRLAEDERRPAHALDPARDQELRLARPDRARGQAHRLHARAAEAVDRGARHARRQTGQQRRHARDVAVVLARLVGAAQDDVVDRRRIEPRMAGEQRLDRHRRQIVGPHRRERPAIAADRRAQRRADEGLGHDPPRPPLRPPAGGRRRRPEVAPGRPRGSPGGDCSRGPGPRGRPPGRDRPR